MKRLGAWRAIWALSFCILLAIDAQLPARAENPDADEMAIVSEMNLALMELYTAGIDISVAMDELQVFLDDRAEGLEPGLSVEQVLEELNSIQIEIEDYDKTQVQTIELPSLSNEIFATALEETASMVRDLPVILNRQVANLTDYAGAILAEDDDLIMALQNDSYSITIALLESENVPLESQMVVIGENHPQRGMQRLQINTNGFFILLFGMLQDAGSDTLDYESYLDRVAELDAKSKWALKDGERHAFAWQAQLLTMSETSERQRIDKTLIKRLADNYMRSFEVESEITSLLTTFRRLVTEAMEEEIDSQIIYEGVELIFSDLDVRIDQRLELLAERQIIIGEYAAAIQALAK